MLAVCFSQIVWYTAAGLAATAAVLTSTLKCGERTKDPPAAAAAAEGAAGAPRSDHDEESGPLPRASVDEDRVGELRGGLSKHRDPHDPWVVSRSMDLHSALDRLNSARRRVERPLLDEGSGSDSESEEVGGAERPLLAGREEMPETSAGEQGRQDQRRERDLAADSVERPLLTVSQAGSLADDEVRLLPPAK